MALRPPIVRGCDTRLSTSYNKMNHQQPGERRDIFPSKAELLDDQAAFMGNNASNKKRYSIFNCLLVS